MTYKMSDLKGIDERHVEQLRQAGIVNTDEMMEAWNNQTKRMSLVTSVGLSDSEFGKLVSLARVARMKGIGPQYAFLLVSAGVKGRKSLSTFTPEGLVKHLGEVRTAKNLTGPMPTLAQVAAWFAEVAPQAEVPAPANGARPEATVSEAPAPDTVV